MDYGIIEKNEQAYEAFSADLLCEMLDEEDADVREGISRAYCSFFDGKESWQGDMTAETTVTEVCMTYAMYEALLDRPDSFIEDHLRERTDKEELAFLNCLLDELGTSVTGKAPEKTDEQTPGATAQRLESVCGELFAGVGTARDSDISELMTRSGSADRLAWSSAIVYAASKSPDTVKPESAAADITVCQAAAAACGAGLFAAWEYMRSSGRLSGQESRISAAKVGSVALIRIAKCTVTYLAALFAGSMTIAARAGAAAVLLAFAVVPAVDRIACRILRNNDMYINELEFCCREKWTAARQECQKKTLQSAAGTKLIQKNASSGNRLSGRGGHGSSSQSDGEEETISHSAGELDEEEV